MRTRVALSESGVRMLESLDTYYAERGDLPWSVGVWGSHPDNDNDDCWTGDEYATEELARAGMEDADWADNGPFLTLSGPGVKECWQVWTDEQIRADEKEREREERAYQRMAQRERAMELGMGLGVEAYNRAMGW